MAGGKRGAGDAVTDCSSTSPNVRKPVNTLTAADLAAFPVWEFALDEEGVEGQDETWVRPLDTRVVPRGEYSLLVAADFRAACGRGFDGFCVVTTVGPEVEIGGAVILRGSDYLPVDDSDWFLSRVGLPQSEMFPATCRLRVPVEGKSGCRTGNVA